MGLSPENKGKEERLIQLQETGISPSVSLNAEVRARVRNKYLDINHTVGSGKVTGCNSLFAINDDP